MKKNPVPHEVVAESRHVGRRDFLKIAGAAAAGTAAVMFAPARLLREADAATVLWSSPTTWPTGRVPGPSDIAVVRPGQTVVLDVNATVAGVRVEQGGVLQFSPNATRTLTSSGNVEVHGRLQMRPSSAARIHTLRFTGVSESRYVGGGMNPLASDVGLWVRQTGVLDVLGAVKTAWARASGSIPAGASQIVLSGAITGWRIGDEVVIVPTASGDYTNFEVRTITSVNTTSRTITLSSPTSVAHPSCTLPNGTVMTAEVLNLTRNVRIEGTPTGRSHVHIMSTVPQSIRYVALRHLGPRTSNGSQPVLGRYALHFHHAHDGSRGSLVEGVVARDLGGHAYVPHESHGITFRNCVAYRVAETAYWWDRVREGVVDSGNMSVEDFAQTHNTTYDRCVAADVYTLTGSSEGSKTAFLHNFGVGNAMLGCVAVGVTAINTASGYFWPAQVPGMGDAAIWRSEDCVAHNIRGEGFRVWQISRDVHVIDRPVVYRTPIGVSHGAYINVYQYRDGQMAETACPLELHAAGGLNTSIPTAIQRFDRMVFDAAGGANAVEIVMHSLAGERPGILQDCNFSGFSDRAIHVDENLENSFSRGASYDFVRCTVNGTRDLEPTDWRIVDIHPSSIMRVQRRNGTAYRISGNRSTFTVTPIPAFAP